MNICDILLHIGDINFFTGSAYIQWSALNNLFIFFRNIKDVTRKKFDCTLNKKNKKFYLSLVLVIFLIRTNTIFVVYDCQLNLNSFIDVSIFAKQTYWKVLNFIRVITSNQSINEFFFPLDRCDVSHFITVKTLICHQIKIKQVFYSQKLLKKTFRIVHLMFMVTILD